MANPLLNGMNPQNGGNPMGNMFNMISNFQKFKQNFIGDPKQQVQELLNSDLRAIMLAVIIMYLNI